MNENEKNELEVADDVMEWFRKIGVIESGHFVMTSGLHSDIYVNKDGAYPFVNKVSLMCSKIADHFSNNTCIPRRNIGVVAAPALGGIALSQWTTYHLILNGQFAAYQPLSVYAEKSADGLLFEFRRKYANLVRGKNVLIVEDILTTGGSVAKVIAAVRKLDGHVVGVGALCNRGGVTAKQLDVPHLYSVTSITANAWSEAKCPLCIDKIEVNVDVGKGREYLARKAEEEEYPEPEHDGLRWDPLADEINKALKKSS